MCGIMGFVATGAVSRHRTVMFLQDLFAGISVRGKDACGYSVVKANNEMVTEKYSRSSDVVAYGNKFAKALDGAVAMIGHARLATHGSPADNRNNHPFVSDDGISVVHNGTLYAPPKLLKITSECDSEYILRAIEKYGVAGAMNLFKRIDTTQPFMNRYAVLGIDRIKRSLFSFRNPESPLIVADLSSSLGLTIFASTYEILKQALIESGAWMPKRLLYNETKPYHLYKLRY